jgi:hypothetical protein
MSLGLLARDSIVDLASYNREDSGGSTSVGSDTAVRTTTDAIISTVAVDNVRTMVDQVGRIQSRPSVTKEANPQQPPSFQYAGLTDDYYSDAYYMDDNSTSNFLSIGGSKSSKREGGFWCCLFPWLAQPKSISSAAADLISEGSNRSTIVPLPSQFQEDQGQRPSAEEGDTESNGESSNSNVLGERLSDKERQAVLARLRLAQPECLASPQPHNENLHHATDAGSDAAKHPEGGVDKNSRQRNKGLLNGIPVYDTSPLNTVSGAPVLKGILKTRSSAKVDEHVFLNGMIERHLSFKGEGGAPKSTNGSSAASSATASTTGNSQLPSGTRRRSLFPSYEEKKPRTPHSVSFSPMARVVTVKSKNDMDNEEKSDVWWQRSDYEDFRKTGRIITRAMLEGGSEIWLTSNDASTNKKKKSPQQNLDIAETGDKWWHKFGHSRRGLEHVVSIEEGRQRQMNVKTAIRAVLEEQARQKMYKREDSEKLRHVALHHTMWARDLALASGASDADAVHQSFSEGRKSREFYLLKMSRSKSSSGSVKLDPQKVPLFMQPSLQARPATGRMASSISPQVLDAHTASQIQFRRQKLQLDTNTATLERETESQEQLHDPDPDDNSRASLAQKAAGFAADREKVNMAAVLSGMGGGVMNQKNEPLPTMRVAS